MKRRAYRRERILVADRSQRTLVQRLNDAMAVLYDKDRTRYAEIVELAEAYVTLHARTLESEVEWQARLARLRNPNPESN